MSMAISSSEMELLNYFSTIDFLWPCFEIRYVIYAPSLSTNKFKTILKVTKFHKGNKEAAFLQAVTTANVMHGIARTCRDGQLTRCGCSTLTRPADLSKEWIWKGCGDNLEYGYKYDTEITFKLFL